MFVLNQFNKFKCTPEALVVQDSALVYFLKTIIGGVGKNSTIKAEFFTTLIGQKLIGIIIGDVH